MNFIASAAANGAIGYDEYSYALGKNYPVAKMVNTAGYYTAADPVQRGRRAHPGADQHDQELAQLPAAEPQQRLHQPRPADLPAVVVLLHDHSDRRRTDPRMTTAKRQTLADFLYYSICQGQAEMARSATRRCRSTWSRPASRRSPSCTRPTAVDLTNENVTTCNNPTFVAGNPNENLLAQIAPQPPAVRQGRGMVPALPAPVSESTETPTS